MAISGRNQEDSGYSLKSGSAAFATSVALNILLSVASINTASAASFEVRMVKSPGSTILTNKDIACGTKEGKGVVRLNLTDEAARKMNSILHKKTKIEYEVVFKGEAINRFYTGQGEWLV